MQEELDTKEPILPKDEDTRLKNQNGVYGFVDNGPKKEPSLFPGEPVSPLPAMNKAEDKEAIKADSQGQKETLSKEGQQALRGEINESDGWIDHGIIDVPVANLPAPEGVSNPADFDHHIQWEDAESATKRLPELQKEVKSGKTGDDFASEDLASGKDYAQGKRRIYDLYYGSDPVVLDKAGEKYDIVSGRHRIFAAKELGLDTIPARVREKKG
jgi:hypothetical protein